MTRADTVYDPPQRVRQFLPSLSCFVMRLRMQPIEKQGPVAVKVIRLHPRLGGVIPQGPPLHGDRVVPCLLYTSPSPRD